MKTYGRCISEGRDLWIFTFLARNAKNLLTRLLRRQFRRKMQLDSSDSDRNPEKERENTDRKTIRALSNLADPNWNVRYGGGGGAGWKRNAFENVFTEKMETSLENNGCTESRKNVVRMLDDESGEVYGRRASLWGANLPKTISCETERDGPTLASLKTKMRNVFVTEIDRSISVEISRIFFFK